MKRVFFINLIISIFLFVFLIACNLEGDDAGSDDNDDEDDAKITIMNGAINDTSKKAAASSGTQMIIAQSNQTGKIYYGFTDSEGNFKIEGNESDIQDETDNSFIVSVIGSDGKPEGTLAFDQPDASTIITGAKFSGDQINLGTIDVEGSSGILTPGSDGDNTADIKDDNIKALAVSGDLAGMSNFGKEGDSKDIDLGGQNSKADGDYDGLPDVIDADDDGNGTIDDFESNFSTNDGADSISAYIRGGVGLN
ncbi:MAG: hypothetical protein KAT05_08120, partial [Spirochaetes bacterium]|nr:hypothetical protein [Spirochaetota bacterium]